MVRIGEILVAFDPGDRTGIARWDGDFHALIVPGDEAIDYLRTAQRTLRLKTVIIEDFIGGGRMSSDSRNTLLLIGRLQGACETLGVRYIMQGSQYLAPNIERACKFLGKPVKKHPDDDCAALSHLMGYMEKSL